jgi:WD40 repeat protein/tRNA A-37 threonylcarbamoyl transferase component Bud32
MSGPTIPDDDRQRRLEEAMAEYWIAADAGRPPERASFLARYPDFRAELVEFLADLSALAGLVDPLLPAAAPREPRATPELVATLPLSAGTTEGGTTTTDPGATIRTASATGTETTAHPQATANLGDGSHDAEALVALPGGTRVRYFGDYELIRELGRGGMGVVYKARQISLNRPVALKMIRSAALASEDELRRFQNEAEAVALLDHPHIVPILEVGNYEGQRYFTMKLIGGSSLKKKLTDYVADPRAAAKLLKQAAEAVHHAHQRGILHRDLKPANILLDEQGEPFVTDFGLAKRVVGDNELTLSGAILGTPAYMAPEQASGRRGAATTASDIYGLGAILYALLTGRAPFESGSVGETLEQVRSTLPSPPSKINPQATGDLEVICLKCLEKDPARRYASAQAVADDLGHYLAGEPITARPTGALERGWLWCKRNPWLAGAIGTTTAALVAVAVISVVSNMLIADALETAKQALEERTKALNLVQAEKQETQRAFEWEQRTSYIHRIALAHREWLAKNVSRAQELLDECPAALRRWEWHYLRRLCHTELLAFRSQDGEVKGVAFSPDGKWIASTGWRTVKIWDAATGQVVITLPGHQRLVTSVAFSADGTRLASAGFQTVKVWDAATGKELLSIPAHKYLISSVAFSPDGKRLASASADQTVKVWDASTGKELLSLPGLPHRANSVAFSPDGKYLAVGSGDLSIGAPMTPVEVGIWDTNTGQEVLALKGHSFWITSVAFSPDGRRLASASADRTVKVWDLKTGQERLTLRGHSGWVRAVAFSLDGQFLASAGDDQVVKLWRASDGREAFTFRGHIHGVHAVAFSPDGRRLASASGDSVKVKAGDVRVWDLTIDQALRTFRGHTSTVTGVAFSPNGKRLASASKGMSSTRPGEIKVCDAVTGRELLTLPARDIGFTAVAYSPDGARIATVGEEGVKLWDAGTGNQVGLLQVFTRPIFGSAVTVNPEGKQVAFSPDGKQVATIGGGRVMVWNVTTGQKLHGFKGHAVNAYGVAFSPDGKRFATSSWGGYTSSSGGYLARLINGAENSEEMPNEVRVWDAATGKECFTLSGGGLGVAFSPDGRRLASGSQEGLVTVWDAGTGKELRTLRGHAGAVSSVAFSPDSDRIASASQDHTVKIWDVSTGQEVLALSGNDEPVESVAFSPDGRYLASGSGLHGEPGQVNVWDADDHSVPAGTP